jgi:hypothetical protein
LLKPETLLRTHARPRPIRAQHEIGIEQDTPRHGLTKQEKDVIRIGEQGALPRYHMD